MEALPQVETLQVLELDPQEPATFRTSDPPPPPVANQPANNVAPDANPVVTTTDAFPSPIARSKSQTGLREGADATSPDNKNSSMNPNLVTKINDKIQEE